MRTVRIADENLDLVVCQSLAAARGAGCHAKRTTLATHCHHQRRTGHVGYPVCLLHDEGASSFGTALHMADRKSVGSGKRVVVRVDLGGRRLINKKTKHHRNKT